LDIGEPRARKGKIMILLFRVLAEIDWPLWPGCEETETRGVEVAAGIDDKGRMALSFKAPNENGSNLLKVCDIVQGRLDCVRPNRVLPALGVENLVAYLVAASDPASGQGDVNGLPRLSYLPSWLPELAVELANNFYWVAIPGYMVGEACRCPECAGDDEGLTEPSAEDYAASVIPEP
jgi:hypothetical protein